MTKDREAPPPARSDQICVDSDVERADFVDEVNAALARHGLQIVGDGEPHDGYLLYDLVDSSTEIDPEAGALDDRLDEAGRRFAQVTEDNWESVPPSHRAPASLMRSSFAAGAAMARSEIEHRARVAGILAEVSRQRRHRGG